MEYHDGELALTRARIAELRSRAEGLAEGYGDPGERRRLAREHQALSAEDRKAGNSARAFLPDV